MVTYVLKKCNNDDGERRFMSNISNIFIVRNLLEKNDDEMLYIPRRRKMLSYSILITYLELKLFVISLL